MVRKKPQKQKTSRGERRSSRKVKLSEIEKTLLGGGLYAKTLIHPRATKPARQ